MRQHPANGAYHMQECMGLGLRKQKNHEPRTIDQAVPAVGSWKFLTSEASEVKQKNYSLTIMVNDGNGGTLKNIQQVMQTRKQDGLFHEL